MIFDIMLILGGIMLIGITFFALSKLPLWVLFSMFVIEIVLMIYK